MKSWSQKVSTELSVSRTFSNLAVKRKNFQIQPLVIRKNLPKNFSGDLNGEIIIVSRKLTKILAVKAITPLEPFAKPPIFYGSIILRIVLKNRFFSRTE